MQRSPSRSSAAPPVSGVGCREAAQLMVKRGMSPTKSDPQNRARKLYVSIAKTRGVICLSR